MSTAIGIDLGSNKAVMGVVKQGGIEIVLSDTSARSVPVQVAYTESERLIGESVKTQIRRNFKNSILFPTRFLGLNSACEEQLKIEKKFTTHKVISNQETNKITFGVQQMGNNHEFSVEQVIGFYLVKLKEFYDVAGIKMTECVLTIPSYASHVERQSLLDAAAIAGLKCPRIINESTAIALRYGFFRQKDFLKEKPRKVAFVDFGHSKTTVTIAEFTPEKLKIICHHSERNLGARDFDYIIMQKLSAQFEKKYGDDPMQSPRCRLRLMEAIETARKRLSADKEAPINVDYLLNEEDLNTSLKREEFEESIATHLTRFREVLQETMALSKLTTEDIESVELLGDATRIPIIQEIIKQELKKEELQRTLNAIDTCSRGASLQAAVLSAQFSVKKFDIEDYNPLPMSVTYTFADKPDNSKTMELMACGSSFPVTKSLSFKNKMGNMKLLLHYSDTNDSPAKLMKGLPNQLAEYQIQEGKFKHTDKDSKSEFIVKVANNIHQIFCLEAAELNEKWTEIEKIPIKAAPVTPTPAPQTEAPKEGETPAAEGEAKPEGEVPAETPAQEQPAPEQAAPAQVEQQYEEKERHRTITSKVKFDTSSHAIPPQTKEQLREMEVELYKVDRNFLDWKKIKYELESYSYSMKEKVGDGGDHVDFIDPAIREEYVQGVRNTLDWTENEGYNAPITEYQQKLTNLTNVGNPVIARFKFHELYPDNRKLLGIEIQKRVFTKEFTVLQDLLQQEKYAHLTEEQRNNIEAKLVETGTYLDKIDQEVAAQAKHVDFPQTNEQIQSHLSGLINEAVKILNTKKPAPKKEEPKKEDTGAAPETSEKPAEGQDNGTKDVEMEEEAPPLEENVDQQEVKADDLD